ncbi:DUF4250 domain-containing protein [Marinomonas posidonica]|uniref:DUF4250 domain-containing protein n=1 Tax=Marinomonas posidonica TaxID=936476 RepID=UPI003736388C
MNLNKQNIASMDINMLFSIINLKLRNDFSSLSSLCASFEIDEQQLTERLKSGGFHFETKENQFKRNPL